MGVIAIGSSIIASDLDDAITANGWANDKGIFPDIFLPHKGNAFVIADDYPKYAFGLVALKYPQVTSIEKDTTDPVVGVQTFTLPNIWIVLPNSFGGFRIGCDIPVAGERVLAPDRWDTLDGNITTVPISQGIATALTAASSEVAAGDKILGCVAAPFHYINPNFPGDGSQSSEFWFWRMLLALRKSNRGVVSG